MREKRNMVNLGAPEKPKLVLAWIALAHVATTATQHVGRFRSEADIKPDFMSTRPSQMRRLCSAS
jgi:hypothetical protein